MSTKRNFGLDLVRACASIAVVVVVHGGFWFYHLWPNQRLIWYLGSMAMDVFFALSGFLIGGILLDTMDSGAGWIRRFWARRWIRTLPNYYLFLLINIAIWLWTTGPVPGWPKFFYFSQNLAWSQTAFFPESWSLALEEIFYLCAPFVLIIASFGTDKPKRTLWICGIAIALAVLARTAWVLQFNPPWDEGVKKIVLTRADAILYGVFAVQWVRYANPSLQLVRRLAVVGAALVVAATLLYGFSNEDTSALARIAPVAMNGAGFAMLLPFISSLRGDSAPRVVRFVSNRLAVWSYAWYLTHLCVMRIMMYLIPQHFGFALSFVEYACYVALSLTWAWANYTLFEKPVLRWRDRIFGGSEIKSVHATTDAIGEAHTAPVLAVERA